jgi:hypothetical protein
MSIACISPPSDGILADEANVCNGSKTIAAGLGVKADTKRVSRFEATFKKLK